MSSFQREISIKKGYLGHKRSILNTEVSRVSFKRGSTVLLWSVHIHNIILKKNTSPVYVKHVMGAGIANQELIKVQ